MHRPRSRPIASHLVVTLITLSCSSELGGDGESLASQSLATVQHAQNIIFCAQDPLTALRAPATYKPVLTADPAYAGWNTPAVVAQLRARFGTVGAWGVQTQVPAQAIRDFAQRLGLDFIIFQGETSEEYRTAIEAGATVIVGNSNAWTPEQRTDATARINRGELAFIFEVYTNEGAPWPNASSSAGVPPASLCLGVYAASSNPTVSDYKAHCPAGTWPTVSVYHAAGMRDADWAALPAAGSSSPPPPPPPPPNPTTPPPPSGCGAMSSNQGLARSGELWNCAGSAKLIHQADGNVVLYRKSDGKALWSTGTYGKATSALTMQADGNLVLSTAAGAAVWSSRTQGHSGARLAVQDDCNLVVYGAGGSALWNSQTQGQCAAAPPPPPPPPCGELHGGSLLKGQSLVSCDRRFTLAMQSDANLVVYQGSTPLWATSTQGSAGVRATMQSDGNFVIYDSAGRALWNTVTQNHPGAYLAMQNDGNLVIYGADGRGLWASNTGGH